MGTTTKDITNAKASIAYEYGGTTPTNPLHI
jgi:hypothetical protein